MLNQTVSNPDYVKGLVLDNLVPLTSDNKNGYPISYITDSNSIEYYLLRSEMVIYDLNLTKKTYLGGWPLGHAATLCPDVNEDCHAQWQALRWGTDEVLEPAVVQRYADYDVSLQYVAGTDGLGCLPRYPLRYSDVTGDGKPELVLLLGGQGHTDFIVFSLEKKQLIFSAPLAIDDVFPKDQMDKYLTISGRAVTSNDPQFWSYIAANYAHKGTDILPALQGYAKLYFGDFNDDGKPDLVVWRKLYESRLNSDPVKGYKLDSNTYVYYALMDGEYKKQTTSGTTIKGWLAAKGLTWQKGYPQSSECAGQTGKPIPEMVDPLLNDPDVLK